ncbi:DUF6779 domain-containing protein [Amycolatopsis sp. CA-230715]|uniref:DUF6779 domain-containing protein n=1 Tax=Amycolatopsis sp. CA-230715 TaxID=2745196 RepID=UPI001C0143BF|nr:DUF6779 domain-containing protein [Amycolatopsis sp. CA-230715]
MTGVGDDSRGRLMGRSWLVAGLLLAVGSTLALVLSDDARLLRLGIVAALWAALLGAFLAVRYRKHASASEDAVAQAQELYELELEREIAARREFELEVEAEARERADDDSREELDALRAEVSALRESLQALFGGEVLYERVALTAQATRMRSLEKQRVVQGANGKQIAASSHNGNGSGHGEQNGVEVPDRPTELIDRVIEHTNGTEQRRTPKPAEKPKPARPEPEVDSGPPTRRVPKPVRVTPSTPPKPAQPARAARAEPPAPRKQEPAPAEPELTRPALDQVERAKPAARPPRAPERKAPAAANPEPGRPKAADLVKGLDVEWTPSWESKDRPVNDLSAAFPARGAEFGPATRRPPAGNGLPAKSAEAPSGAFASGEPSRRDLPPARPSRQVPAEASQPAMPPARPNPPRAEPPRPERQEPARQEPPRKAAAQPEPMPSARLEPQRQPEPEPAPSRPSRHGSHTAEPAAAAAAAASVPEEPQPNPTLPPSVREIQESRSGGRRRRAEDDDEPMAESGGGRRRRPDGEPPAWEAPGANGRHTGSHAKPDDANGSGRRRAAGSHSSGYTPQPESSGSHGSGAGRSVTELLAAHGSGDTAPRRRRRAED